MKRLSKVFVLLIAFIVFTDNWVNAFPERDPCEPTAEQRREIEELINRGNTYRQGYDRCKAREAEHRVAGDPYDLADKWKELAERWRELEQQNRLRTTEKIDEYYCIDPPANTVYEYNPNSSDYAFVPREGTSKDRKRVVFCPDAFASGADLAASVKLHELRHAWQVHNCWSTDGTIWRHCTLMNHLAELDAYSAEERAYDAGITGGMPDEEKELIRRRIRQHRREAFPFIPFFFLTDLIHILPGDFAFIPAVLVNTSNEPREFTVEIHDERGWQIFPSPDEMEPVFLEPEQEYFFEFATHVPEDALPGPNRFRVILHQDTPIAAPCLKIPHLWLYRNTHMSLYRNPLAQKLSEARSSRSNSKSPLVAKKRSPFQSNWKIYWTGIFPASRVST